MTQRVTSRHLRLTSADIMYILNRQKLKKYERPLSPTEWLISHSELDGAINLAAPNPLPNDEMMRILRQVCGAPFGLPAARWMLEVGAFLLRTETELIIKSRRVIPRRLLESGFQFRFPGIHDAFADLSQPGKGVYGS